MAFSLPRCSVCEKEHEKVGPTVMLRYICLDIYIYMSLVWGDFIDICFGFFMSIVLHLEL